MKIKLIPLNVFVNLPLLFSASSLLLPFISFEAHSASEPSDLFELPLEDLLDIEVLSPSQTVKKIGQAPNIITSITAKQIASMGARTLSDVLKMVPGVQVLTRRNGQDMVWIRGIPTGRNSKVMLLIDGVPQREGLIGGWSSDEQTQINNIERIEVIRGPGSALYGGDAYSGMISIFTKHKVPQYNTVTAGIASFDKQWLNFEAGKEVGQSKLIVSGRWQQSEGYAQQYDRAGLDSTHNNNVKAKSLSGTFLSGNWQLGANFDDFTTEYPHYSSDQYKSQRYEILSAYLKHVFNFDKLTIENQLYTYQVTRTFERTIKDLDASINFYSDSDLDSDSNGLRSQWSYAFNSQQHTVFGLIYQQRNVSQYHETISLKNGIAVNEIESRVLKNGDSSPASHNRAVYIQHESLWMANQLGVTLGARVDDYPEFDTEISPRVALTYQSNQDWSGKVILGTAFRPPTFLQQYEIRNDNNVSGNPALTPEQIETIEAEWVYHFSTNNNLAIRGFRSRLSDFIQSIDGKPYENSETQLAVPGYEIEWNKKYQTTWLFFNRISTSFNYTRVNSDQASLAKNTLNWLVFAEDTQFSFYLGLNYLGRRNESDTYHSAVKVAQLAEQDNKRSYWTLDSHLSYRPHLESPWLLTLSAKNVLNKQHYNPTLAPDSYYDVRKEPRSLDLSLSYRFK